MASVDPKPVVGASSHASSGVLLQKQSQLSCKVNNSINMPWLNSHAKTMTNLQLSKEIFSTESDQEEKEEEEQENFPKTTTNAGVTQPGKSDIKLMKKVLREIEAEEEKV